jgi:hypothetical protein
MSSVTPTVIKGNVKYFDICFHMLRNYNVHNNFTNIHAEYFHLHNQSLLSKAAHVVHVPNPGTFYNTNASLGGRVVGHFNSNMGHFNGNNMGTRRK